MQEIHGVDDQRDVARVLALGVGEILLGLNGEPRQHLRPAGNLRTGEIAVDAARRCFA